MIRAHFIPNFTTKPVKNPSSAAEEQPLDRINRKTTQSC
jgi:hypothetical protein